MMNCARKETNLVRRSLGWLKRHREKCWWDELTMRAVLIILLLVGNCLGGEPNAPGLFNLAEVVPKGKCELELMTIDVGERVRELSRKMEAAMKANSEWFLEAVKKAKPGEPLDYDTRLGVTKEEWAEYLRDMKKRHLASRNVRVPCIFRWRGDTVSLDIGDPNSPLSQIRLDTKTGELAASVGRMGKPIWRSREEAGSPIGAFDACTWKYEKSDLDAYDVRVGEVELRLLKPSGKMLWEVRDQEMVHKVKKRNFEVLFQYSPGVSPAEGVRPGNPPVG